MQSSSGQLSGVPHVQRRSAVTDDVLGGGAGGSVRDALRGRDMADQEAMLAPRAAAPVQRKPGAAPVQMDETAEKIKATTQETNDGGHSLLRHGPEVTEEALERRLKTGMTAKIDGPGEVFSPAPGFVSKFLTYAAVNKTRAAAAAEANSGIATTLAGVKGEADAVTTKLGEVKTAKETLDKADPSGKAAAGKAFGTARAALVSAETALRNKARTFDPASVAGVPVSYEKPDPATAGLEYLKLRPSYKVVKNHGEVIGLGIRGDKKDLTDTHGEGGTPHENVYETVKPKEDVSSTQTAFNASGGKQLSTVDATTEANSWTAGQHYPCAPEEPVGIS
jgi:hypothetical protein